MQVPTSSSEFQAASGTLDAMKVNENKTAKLFHMMSSTLYTDKYMSILRELCSNARDSHVEAGKLDTPFAIIAPSEDYLYLTVSDVGTGLTYEKAKRTILEFLSSTKDEGTTADDFIGGWGIGAKVPRAYTDNYQVHLRKSGVEWIVQIINDAAGLPFQMLMSEHKTHKPDGVDMVVPIQPLHVRQWREKVYDYVHHTNYNVIAYMGKGEVVKPKKPYRVFDFENFKLEVREFSGYSSSRDIKVIYGGMVYEIPSGMQLVDQKQRILKKTRSGYNLYLRFDMPNSLRCGLSREQLEVDEANRLAIYKALLVIEDQLAMATGRAGVVDSDNTLTLRSISEVQKLNEKFLEEEKATETSVLRAIALKSNTEVKFSPDGLQKPLFTYKGWSVEYVFQILHMPMSEDDVKELSKVTVIYSDKFLTKKDLASAAGIKKFLVHCPIKTDSEDVAKAWAAERKDLEGCELNFVFTESTRTIAARKRSFERYAVCAVTGKRLKLSTSEPIVLLEDKSQAWKVIVSGDACFVPAKSFKMKNVPEGTVILQKDYVPNKESFGKLNGCKTDRLWYKSLQSAVKQLQKISGFNSGNLPSALYKQRRVLEESLSGKVYVLREAYGNLSAIEAVYGEQNLSGVQAEYEFEADMRKVNSYLAMVERSKNLFTVLDVDNVLKEYKNGNPQAMKVFLLFDLEQFA